MRPPRNVPAMRKAFRAALSARRQTRHALARSIRQALRDHRAAIIASLRDRAAPNEAAEPAALDARVLNVIRQHPGGVHAVEVGNELGVDWRCVLDSTRALVDAGLVEQVDLEFYASPKASPRW